MQIIFDNESFVAVDKPAGWLTVPSRMGAQDARPCVGRELEQQLGVRLWPVHRLDAEVSGIVLFAKNAEAHRRANAWFERHDVRKEYEADCEPARSAGAIRPRADESFEWRSRLLRGKKRAYESPHGKEAVTRATFVGEAHGRWRWRLWPLTGRPHQLRVHLAAQGCPIVGDALYGARTSFHGGGIALRAVRLDLSGCPGARELGLPMELAVPGLGG